MKNNKGFITKTLISFEKVNVTAIVQRNLEKRSLLCVRTCKIQICP